jgi:predicted dehydrogenase
MPNTMNRREFLAASAAAVQPSRRVRVAFLGLAHSHAPEKLRLVSTSPDYELVGAWEDNEKVRQSFAKSNITWLERRKILADPAVEAVFVESDVPRHEALGLEAVQVGKHVHIEKPPSDNVRGFRAIVDVAKRKRLHLQTGYMWRFNPAVLRAIEAAKQGWLGEVYLIHARMNTLIGADRRPEWDLFTGGQMFEQGAHLIDIVVRTLGTPTRITPFLRHDGGFADKLKDNTAAVLEYPRAMAIITASVLQPSASGHRALEIMGSTGTAVVRPIEPPSLEIDLAEAAGPYVKGRQKVALPPYARYAADIAELARAIRGEAKLSVTLDEELAVQETLITASKMVR